MHAHMYAMVHTLYTMLFMSKTIEHFSRKLLCISNSFQDNMRNLKLWRIISILKLEL